MFVAQRWKPAARVSASDLADLLEGATVNILPMSHLHYNDDELIFFSAVYNTIRTLAYPIFIMTG